MLKGTKFPTHNRVIGEHHNKRHDNALRKMKGGNSTAPVTAAPDLIESTQVFDDLSGETKEPQVFVPERNFRMTRTQTYAGGLFFLTALVMSLSPAAAAEVDSFKTYGRKNRSKDKPEKTKTDNANSPAKAPPTKVEVEVPSYSNDATSLASNFVKGKVTKPSPQHSGSPQSDTSLKNFIVPIILDPTHYEMAGITKEKYIEQFELFKTRILKLLPYVTSIEMFQKIANTPGFAIAMVPDSLVGGGASYRSDSNQIHIGLTMGEQFNDEGFITVLRNEFFHASTCRLGKNAPRKKMPCLAEADNLKLEVAVDKGFDRVKKYDALIKKYEKSIGKSQNSVPAELSQLEISAEKYRPFSMEEIMSMEQHKAYINRPGFKRLSSGRILISAGSIEYSGIKTVTDLYLTPIKVGKNNVKQIMTTYDLSDPGITNAKAFVRDTIFRYTHFYQGSGHYAKMEKMIQTENIGSDIAELPEDLKKLVYGEFCMLMSALTDVKDFCDTPSFRPG